MRASPEILDHPGGITWFCQLNMLHRLMQLSSPSAGPTTSATLPRSQPGPRQRAVGPGGADGRAVGLGSAADLPNPVRSEAKNGSGLAQQG